MSPLLVVYLGWCDFNQNNIEFHHLLHKSQNVTYHIIKTNCCTLVSAVVDKFNQVKLHFLAAQKNNIFMKS